MQDIKGVMYNKGCMTEQTVKQRICFKKNFYHIQNGMEELILWRYMDMCACPVWIRMRTDR